MPTRAGRGGGRWRARGRDSARAPGSIATSAPLTLDGGVAPEGPSVDPARVPASPAPGSGRTRRGGGGFAAGEARTAMPLASVTFCAAARALAAITAAMSLMVAADRAPRD